MRARSPQRYVQPTRQTAPSAGIREGVCVSVLVLTFLLPAIHAGMLQLHRLTLHGPTAVAGPTALQNLTSLADHWAARAAGEGSHRHEASAEPSAPAPERWIHVEGSGEEPHPTHSGAEEHGHAHSHPHPSAGEADETHADPAAPHRHGGWVHSHDDGEKELETLAAGLLKLFFDASGTSLPALSYVAADRPPHLLTVGDTPIRIDLPPPRFLSA